jgi:hypothetical protein
VEPSSLVRGHAVDNQLDERLLRERPLGADFVALREPAGGADVDRLGRRAAHHQRARGGHERERERIRERLARVEVGPQLDFASRGVLGDGDELDDERGDLAVLF